MKIGDLKQTVEAHEFFLRLFDAVLAEVKEFSLAKFLSVVDLDIRTINKGFRDYIVSLCAFDRLHSAIFVDNK